MDVEFPTELQQRVEQALVVGELARDQEWTLDALAGRFEAPAAEMARVLQAMQRKGLAAETEGEAFRILGLPLSQLASVFTHTAGSGLKPDTNRRREALESFPLDAIRMVGHMTNGRSSFALLQVDSTVYQARVGNYAGLNYGMITRVSESEVRLKELVQDAAGDWIERETALQLKEGPPVQETKK